MPVYSQKGYPVKAEESLLLLMWNDDIAKANIYRHIISYGIHMGGKIESCTRIFLFDRDRFYFDTSRVK